MKAASSDRVVKERRRRGYGEGQEECAAALPLLLRARALRQTHQRTHFAALLLLLLPKLVVLKYDKTSN
jgi:hypothetical protein